jgi:hypothetical protein
MEEHPSLERLGLCLIKSPLSRDGRSTPVDAFLFSRHYACPLWCGAALSPAVNILRTTINFLFTRAIGNSGGFPALVTYLEKYAHQFIHVQELEFTEITNI